MSVDARPASGVRFGQFRESASRDKNLELAAFNETERGAIWAMHRAQAAVQASRRSVRHRANRAASPRRRSTLCSARTPLSDDKRPLSKATLSFLRQIAGNRKRKSCPPRAWCSAIAGLS